MIRPATLADIDSIIWCGAEWLEQYPLRADEDKMRKVLTEAISGSRHFAWVSESPHSGIVHGVLLGLTGDNLWAQRLNCNVVAWIARVHGDGEAMMREFVRWVKSRRAIKVAGMIPDLNGVDPRVWKLAKRLGFEQHGGAYLLYN